MPSRTRGPGWHRKYGRHRNFQGPWGPWALIFGAQTTKRHCGGLWGTSAPSLCPVVLEVFLLEVAEERVFRRRRRRLSSKRRISMPCFTGIDKKTLCRKLFQLLETNLPFKNNVLNLDTNFHFSFPKWVVLLQWNLFNKKTHTVRHCITESHLSKITYYLAMKIRDMIGKSWLFVCNIEYNLQ